MWSNIADVVNFSLNMVKAFPPDPEMLAKGVALA